MLFTTIWIINIFVATGVTIDIYTKVIIIVAEILSMCKVKIYASISIAFPT
jgi:hypothetical protein